MNVSECDLLDEQAYAKFNDNYKYILLVNDVFSIFVHTIPIKTKSGPSVASLCLSIFNDPTYTKRGRPIWVRTDEGKEFVNKHFQVMLRHEGEFSSRCVETPT